LKTVYGPFDGMAGRAGAMRAIDPSTTPRICPRQGLRRPTPRSYVAGARRLKHALAVVRRARSYGQRSKSPKAHRREGYLTTVQIKPVMFSVFRCT
jgi:hypothetical protein